MDEVLEQLRSVIAAVDDRGRAARSAAEIIRIARGYRWVGLYDVAATEIVAVGWTGANMPAFPRFPKDRGLNGAAVRSARPVVVQDVSTDPRYLTTFGSTGAEAIYPVLSPSTGEVIGTIDAESDRKDAFTPDDDAFLSECARALLPLWLSPQKTPAEAMRELRRRMLTDAPSDFGIRPTTTFPLVYGVLMDWPVDETTATVVSLSTGDASLYTTSTFGIIGGIGHESVRTAATKFVKAVETYHADSIPTSEFPYPAADRVRFYLLTFHGLRVIDTDLASIASGKGRYANLFRAGQAVLSELRLITERRP